MEQFTKALKECLEAMETQEERMAGNSHISSNAFKPIWDEAKAKAKEALKDKTTVVIEFKGKREDMDQMRIHVFSKEYAEAFCEQNSTDKQKYWTKCFIVDTSKSYEYSDICPY